MKILSKSSKGFLLSVLFLLFYNTSLKAQQKSIPGVPDSLMNRSYKELRSIYYQLMDKGDNLEAQRYINIHIGKAKLQGDTLEIARGYVNMSVTSTTKNIAYKYIDLSLIHI